RINGLLKWKVIRNREVRIRIDWRHGRSLKITREASSQVLCPPSLRNLGMAQLQLPVVKTNQK
ncbi:hypothetical protein QYM36_007226, partial [Artemia franciscana]